MQASSLQQRLMVSAFQCHFVDQYNRFVLGHQPELQKFDAALLTFFKRGDPNGMMTYNACKTHLANISALKQAHSYTFCDDITGMYQRAAGTTASQDGLMTDETQEVSQPATSAGGSLATSDATPAWVPDEPLIAADQDQVGVPVHLHERAHRVTHGIPTTRFRRSSAIVRKSSMRR